MIASRDISAPPSSPALHLPPPPQADNINTIVKAAGITVEPYWPSLFVKLFSKKSVEDLICNIGAGGWRLGAAAGAAAAHDQRAADSSGGGGGSHTAGDRRWQQGLSCLHMQEQQQPGMPSHTCHH
jgi:ribosomal protein L12E/L44/L45/RPP1/RPP2